jgi:hypothetical protein
MLIARPRCLIFLSQVLQVLLESGLSFKRGRNISELHSNHRWLPRVHGIHLCRVTTGITDTDFSRGNGILERVAYLPTIQISAILFQILLRCGVEHTVSVSSNLRTNFSTNLAFVSDDNAGYSIGYVILDMNESSM